MANPIPYTIKKGDTLSSIAREKKINSWKDLQVYHNQNCPKEEMIGTTLKEGKTLYVPSQDEIDEMNGVKKNPASETETKPEEKKQEEKPKEEQKKEEKKEDSKSEHDGKYYVVHGATCVCDKAEDPTKEAELQVTTHQKMIYNDQAKKWAATEEDKQFNPPAATFGKCKLKPSSSGYLPCALAPAPKWNKPYDKTKVMGKSVLTEISELQCTVGGKITIKKHGQTDAASTAHAQNTNPAEMAHANPAVKKPTPKADFPMVNFITLETVENRPTFKPIKSSDSKNNVEKIYVRPNENCSFTANVSKGNKSLTSWVIYDGFEGKSDQKTLTKEQIGPSFSNSFPALGNFRVEGYGKPKTKEYENGKYDKNDASCSIDVTVAINTLVENQLEMYGEDFAATIKQEVRLRKDFPAAFKAKFLMPPTPEELARLEMYVTDEAGNRLSDYLHEGKRLTYTPTNADTVYIFHAVYHDEQGNPHKQTFKGKTLTKNYVVTISNTDQVVREFSPIGFEVKKMSIGSFIAADSDLTQSEIQDIKWNLNGVYQNSGRVLSIPRGLPIGKYVVEAFCSMANAYGAKAKKEDDDRHFEVKRNDVVEIQSDPILKVGKKATFTASGFVFKDLLPNEKVNWTLDQQSLANSKTMVTTFRSVGRTTVTAKINAEKGITKTFTVVQPILENVMFTDSQGIQIEKSSWGNKVNIWLKEKYVTGEKLKISLVVGTTPVYHFPEKVYDGGLIELHLNDDIRKYAKNEATLKVVVNATELDLPNEGKPLGALEVSYAREVYSGQIGTEDGKKKHSPVDYDMVSWFYGKSRGIKDTEKVTIEIWEDNFLIDEKLLSGEASPDKSGALRFKIDWGKIPKGKQGSFKKVYAKVIDNNQNKTVLFDGDALFTKNYTPLIAKSTVTNLAGYSSAAVVGSTSLSSSSSNGSCACKEYDLIWGNKVSCDFRKKVVEIAKRLSKDPNLLMAAMALETGRTFSPTAGKGTSYVGLIQFGDDAASSIGTTRDALLKMSAIEQLDYVEKYLAKKKDKLVTLTDFYLSILMPVDVGKGSTPNHVVFDNEYPLEYKKDGKTLTDLSKSRHYGYRQNRAFLYEEGEKEKVKEGGGKLYDGPGKTYVWEIEKFLSAIYEEGKVNKARVFECNKEISPKVVEVESGTWNVVITEKYTGKKCEHEKARNNCRRGKIEVFDHNKKLVLTISDCLLEGVAGEDRMVTNSDAPFGTYSISSTPFIMGASSGQKRISYGPNPRLSFEPIEGSGDEADKSNRSLIRIHGGRQEDKTTFEPLSNPILKRTQGCIRVYDSDAKSFYDWWVNFNKSNPNIKPGKLKIIK